jgi:hypothetical protein
VSNENRELLKLIEVLVREATLNYDVGHFLELLVLREDPALLAAYDLYVASNFSRLGWLEFWDTLRHIVQPYYSQVQYPPNLNLEPLSVQLDRCVDALFYEQFSKFLTETGYMHLKKLLATGDVILEAAYMTFRDTSDFEEFYDTLIRLSNQWRKQPEYEPYVEFIDNLFVTRSITHDEWDFLLGKIYTGCPVLWSAHAVMEEELQDGLREEQAILNDLYDTICRVLERHYISVCLSSSATVKHFIESLSAQFSSSTIAFLLDLVDANDEVLFASLSQYSDTGSADDLLDSLARIGSRWRIPMLLPILNLLQELHEENIITLSELDTAEYLVYTDNTDMMSAFNTLRQNHMTDDFIASLMSILACEAQKKFTAYALKAMHCVEFLEQEREVSSKLSKLPLSFSTRS